MNGAERLYLPARSEPKRVDEEERVLDVTITTRERDREGDIVEPSGLDFGNFLENPVVLWAHDTAHPPIGRVRSITVLDDRVDAKVQFADTEQGRECFALYRDRYLNAWSIGFLPRAWTPLAPSREDPRRGFHITSAEVVELSGVPVPANPRALTRDIESGTLTLSKRMQKALDLPARQPEPKRTPPKPHLKNIPLRDAVDMARTCARRMMRAELARAVAAARGKLSN